MRSAHLVPVAVLTVFPLLGACDDLSPPVEPAPPGHVTVVLDSEPASGLQESWARVHSIYLQTTTADSDPAESQEYIMVDGRAAYPLHFGVERILVSGAEAPPGTYRSIHLVVRAACVVNAEGQLFASSFNASWCEGEETGILRLVHGDSANGVASLGTFTVRSDTADTLWLEMNVAESFLETDTGWVIDPQLSRIR